MCRELGTVGRLPEHGNIANKELTKIALAEVTILDIMDTRRTEIE